MQGLPRTVNDYQINQHVMTDIMATLCDHNDYQERAHLHEEEEDYPSTIKILVKYGYPVNTRAPKFGSAGGGVVRWCHALAESRGWLDFEVFFSEDVDPEMKAREEEEIANSLQWCLQYSYGSLLYTDDMWQSKKSFTWTPLQYAAASGSARAVRSLLECGADFSLKDEEGQTALDIAKGLEREEVVGVLMAWSADV
jgi:hypothetical protein